jgi:hypothetical protein
MGIFAPLVIRFTGNFLGSQGLGPGRSAVEEEVEDQSSTSDPLGDTLQGKMMETMHRLTKGESKV